LAKNGLGTTYPNPLVGSVIVHNNKIIGEGWHYKAGQPHAEVNAINSVKDKSLLKESTIYVSLEPCSHFGKTPPCADLITKHQIKNIVIGCVDSFSEVSGKGIEKLKNNGCNVTVGVLEEECLDLNKRFFTFHTKKRPYIILKWAETKDGLIAPENNTEITWITNTYSRQLVHKLRSEEQAILVGTNTVLTDNPKLDCRTWHGQNPVKIILDRLLRIPKHYSVFDKTTKTIVYTEIDCPNEENLIYEQIDFSKDIAQQVCETLYKHNIQSVIIEGGNQTLQTFIDANLWDEAHVFSGSSVFKTGIKAPNFIGQLLTSSAVKEDHISIYQND
jgi:diaminohydroxyphosphoribosylaminopyrimidine deaminase/5-amino-6-(5-phosphoribosylamino)uracil reductase